MERETGLEPATSTLARWRSTTEPLPHVELFRPDSFGTPVCSASGLVGEMRVELLRHAALEPKSSVSAIPPLARITDQPASAAPTPVSLTLIC